MTLPNLSRLGCDPNTVSACTYLHLTFSPRNFAQFNVPINSARLRFKQKIHNHDFKTFYEHMSQSGFEGFLLSKYQISFNLIGVLVSNVTFKLLKKSTKR